MEQELPNLLLHPSSHPFLLGFVLLNLYLYVYIL